MSAIAGNERLTPATMPQQAEVPRLPESRQVLYDPPNDNRLDFQAYIDDHPLSSVDIGETNHNMTNLDEAPVYTSFFSQSYQPLTNYGVFSNEECNNSCAAQDRCWDETHNFIVPVTQPMPDQEMIFSRDHQYYRRRDSQCEYQDQSVVSVFNEINQSGRRAYPICDE